MKTVFDSQSNMTIEEKAQVIKLEKILDNAYVLSNVVELATDVVSNLSVSDISDTIGNETLGRSIVSNLVAKRFLDRSIRQEK